MPIHIVHIEDDEPLQNLLKTAFLAAEPDMRLQQYISGDDAFAYIEENAQVIDLFVLDIRLPGSMNGLQIAQKIREIECPGFIVLTSAFSSPKDELLTSLRSEYIPKPWHILDLTQKLLQYRLTDRAN